MQVTNLSLLHKKHLQNLSLLHNTVIIIKILLLSAIFLGGNYKMQYLK